KLGGRKVGTTGKGIGPCYSDKASRRGVRVGEILDEALFERKLRTLDASYRARFGELEYNVEDEIALFKVCFSLFEFENGEWGLTEDRNSARSSSPTSSTSLPSCKSTRTPPTLWLRVPTRSCST